MATTKKDTGPIEINKITMARITATLMGTTPLIMHRFSAKAWQELLAPSEKKNAAARAESLKHDPLTEFRECVYRNRTPNAETLLHFPSGAFGKAIAAAALDLPGASRAQMLRLVSVASTQVDIWGIPLLGMDMVRSSDIARTPDVRSRPYLPEWTCDITIEYVASLIGQQQILNLLNAAGIIVGIGDHRPQKGGAFGKFVVMPPNEPSVAAIRSKQGYAAQKAALHHPAFYNEDSRELYEWFTTELKRREKTAPSTLIDGLPPLQSKTAKPKAKKGKRDTMTLVAASKVKARRSNSKSATA
jgi:hypothetical protein